MRKRTKAREVALQTLYQYDLSEQQAAMGQYSSVDDFEEFIRTAADDPEVREYARRLVDGILSQIEELDAEIAAVSENWRLNRTAAIDRCAIRIGLYEIRYEEDVPPKVAINEAIELVKRFSAERSNEYVNGILDKLLAKIE